MKRRHRVWTATLATLFGLAVPCGHPARAEAPNCLTTYHVVTITDPPVDVGGCYGDVNYWDWGNEDDCPRDYGVFYDQLSEFQTSIETRAPLSAKVRQQLCVKVDPLYDPDGVTGHHYAFWWYSPEYFGQWEFENFNFRNEDDPNPENYLGGWHPTVPPSDKVVISLPYVADTVAEDPLRWARQTCDIIIPKSPKGPFPSGQWTVNHLQYNLQVINKWKRVEADNQLSVATQPNNRPYEYEYRIAPYPFPETGVWADQQVNGAPVVFDHINDAFGVQVRPKEGQDADDPREEGCYFQNGRVFDYWRGDDGRVYSNPCYRWVPDNTLPPAPVVPDAKKAVTAVWKRDIELAVHIVRVGWTEDKEDPSTVTISSRSDSVEGAPITSSQDFRVRLTHGYKFKLEPHAEPGYAYVGSGFAIRCLDVGDGIIAAMLPGESLSSDVIWLRGNPMEGAFDVAEPAGPCAYYSGGVITVFFMEEGLLPFLREQKAAAAKRNRDCFDITSWLGDPVYPHSGEFCEEAEDLRVKCPGMDFVWSRMYCSRNGADTAQGCKWDHGYNIRVERLGTGHILYHDGHGRMDLFAPTGENNEWKAHGRMDTLEYAPFGSATPILHLSDGTTQSFEPPPSVPGGAGGKLTSIRDRNGNQMGFYYDNEGRLTSVTDTLGRRYWIAYNGASPDRIAGVHEEDGEHPRSVGYAYDGAGNLAEVHGPGAGETTTYGYDGQHNLTTITDARGNTYLRNLYGGSPASGYRVTSQTWGNSGDGITFEYSSAAGLSERTTVTDRDGNVMDLFFGGSFLWKKDETEKDGGHVITQYAYNGSGLPVSIRYPEGNRTLYEYGHGDPVNPITVCRGSGSVSDDIVERFTYLPGLSGCSCGTSFVRTFTDGRGFTTTNDYDGNGNLTSCERRVGAAALRDAYTRNDRGQVTAHTWPGGRVDRFEYERGYLTGIIQDENGVHASVSLQRDDRGNVTEMLDARGYTHWFEYDAHDRVTLVKSPAVGTAGSNVVTFTYDGNGNTTKVRFDNTVTGEWQEASYEYEILNCLTKSTLSGSSGTPESNPSLETTYEYDGNRNVTDIIPGGGGIPITFEYNARNMVTDIHRGDITVSYEYDGNGNVTAAVCAGRRHEYAYDSHNQLVNAKDPLGNLTSLAHDANGNITDVERRDGAGKPLFAAKYGYDEVNRLISEAAGGATTTFAYNTDSQLTGITNPNAHSVTFGRDTMGRLASVSDDAGESVSYEYDKNGNVLYATRKGLDGVPYVTGYTYDALNRLATAVDSANHQTIYGYDARSNLASVTGPDGMTSTFGYDGLNRLVQAVHQIDATHQATLSQAWDNQSRLASRTDGTGQTTRYGYDELDRISAVTYADNSSRTYEYYPGAEGGALERVIAPNGSSAVFEYDALNRITRRTVTKGASTEAADFAYDGLSRLVSARVAGSRVSLEYDALGNLTAEALNGEVVRATHDPAGNRETLTYPHGRTLSFAYDAAERLTGVSQGGDALVAYTFGKPGRLASKVLGNGVATVYGYDGALNVNGITAGKGGTGVDQWGFVWDSVRNKTDRTDVLANVASGFQHDGLGRLVGSVNSAGDNVTVAYALDAAGNRTGVTGGPDAGSYVLGTVHAYASAPVGPMTHDANGNLLTINAGQPNAQEFVYDALDRLASHVAHHAGGWQVMAGSWTAADNASAAGSGRIVKAREAGFDALRLTYTADSVSTDAESYGFAAVRAGTDANGCVIYVGVRIHGANIELLLFGPSGETVLAVASDAATVAGTAYDLALNIDPATGAVTLQRALHGQALATMASASTGATGLSPDMLILGAGTATSYTFTNVATLVGNTPQGDLPDRPVITTFQYDPFGRKVRKIVEDGVHPPQTTRYAYSGWQVVEEQDNAGALQASYVYGRYIDEPIQMTRGENTTVYYHSDDLYNVTALTNTAGDVVERYRYDDFGAPHIYDPSTGVARSASNYGNPYLFTGRAYDADLGLYDYRTRHLQPGLGRFTTRDQIGLWGDSLNLGNPYTYVGNAPGMFVDPYGLFTPLPPVTENETGYASRWSIAVGQSPLGQAVAAVNGALEFTPEDRDNIEGLAGMAPVIGVPFNLDLARKDFGNGRYVSGSFNFAAAVPFLGGVLKAIGKDIGMGVDLAKSLKAWARAGVVSDTGKLLKNGSSACDAAAGAVERAARIDAVKQELEELAAVAAETVGEGQGRLYGTEVHKEFKKVIDALEMKDVFTERSYLAGEAAKYGTKDSIRADLVVGPLKEPMAVFDLKTGNASLSATRVRQIQSQLPGGRNVPVIEIRPRR